MSVMRVSFPTSLSGPSTVKQWEATGASLVTALANYAGACLTLGSNFDYRDIHSRHMATQIDWALRAHSDIILQLNTSGAGLAGMRNQVVTPFHRIPDELLSQIFQHYIYDPQHYECVHQPKDRTSTEYRISLINRRRHKLLSICSVWRRVISDQASFWSSVLVTGGGITADVLYSYIQRSSESGVGLLITNEETISAPIISTLSMRNHQIRALTIQSASDEVFKHVAKLFPTKEISHSLSELSLHWTGGGGFPFRDSESLTPRNSRRFLNMSTLIEPLTILRTNNIYFHWDPTRATNLVELQIQSLGFYDNQEMLRCFESISSAPQLRDLKLFSVFFYYIPGASQDSPWTPHTMSFPKLQDLTLGDLHLFDLKMILNSISSNTHRLTLCLTGKTFMNIQDDQPVDIIIKALIDTLSSARVDSLLLEESSQQALKRGIHLFKLLGCMPGLKTLKMDGWFFTNRVWDALERDIHGAESSSSPEFPRLQNLHLTNVALYDEERLKNLVQHHRIQRLELGAQKCSSPSDTDHEPTDYRPLSAETVNWLRSMVPQFHLANPTHSRPKFNIYGWERELW